MTKKTLLLCALLGSTALAGCQYHARSAEDYSRETKQVLAAKQSELKHCYDEILKKDKKARGVVSVNFKVLAKTGELVEPTLNEEKTTAPEELSSCVLSSLDGLKLDPPDAREGVVSWDYEFTPNN